MSAPVLYAHRGAAKELPENTLPAFLRALAIGADALEMDVHLTRDGHVVVAHDATAERTAGIPRAIADATLAEVKTWNVGASRGASGTFAIPTLAEVLDAIPRAPINIDIKRHGAIAARAVVSVITQRRASARVLLTSFDARTIAEVRRLGYEGPTGLGAIDLAALALAPRALARRFVAGAAAQVPRRSGPFAFDTRAFIDKAHALGLAVHFWTIDDPSEAERLLDLGADGIMTDDPAAIVPVFARRRTRS